MKNKKIKLFCLLTATCLIWLFSSNNIYGQTIIGPTCVVKGTAYSYHFSTTSTSYSWSATNGTINGATNMVGVSVTWNSAGAGTLNLTYATGQVHLNVTIVNPLSGGTTSNNPQTIPYNTIPGTISCGVATGGNCSPVYTYQWKQSTDDITYVNVSTSLSSGPTAQNLVFSGQLTQTTYFKRFVTETGTGSTATSDRATVFVLPQLLGGTISGSTTINYNTAPPAFSNVQLASGGGCSATTSPMFSYIWQQSSDNVNFNDMSLFTDPQSMSSVSLLQTTYFRRKVNCQGNIAYSNVIQVIVRPAVYAGTIAQIALNIPSGTSPGPIVADAASGGGCSGSYSYFWQSSSSATSGFADITGTGTSGLDYTPGTLTTTTYFRRRVQCGTDIEYTNVCQVVVGTPLAELNYIRVRNIKKPGITTDAAATALTTFTDVGQTTQYFDGLGRLSQTVAWQFSPLQRDMVTLNMYDAAGREIVKYMPYSTTVKDGNNKPYPLGDLLSFNGTLFPNEQNYYLSYVNTEASPLNRGLVSYSPGSNWLGSKRGVASQSVVNSIADSVRIWDINATAGSLPTSTLMYAAGQLMVDIITDEQNHNVVEYKDKDGRVILKKVQLATTPGTAHVGWLCTYYVYDDLSNLRFVLQPRAVELINYNAAQVPTTTWTITQAIADELCFRYEYDQRKRMIIKKVPGAGETWMVYDQLDRLVLTEDANLRTAHQWVFTKYDAQDRVIMTGIFTDATHTTQSSMQSFQVSQNLGRFETTTTANQIGYTTTATFPNLSSTTWTTTDWMTLNFYDNYSWQQQWFGTSYSQRDNTNDNLFYTASNTINPYIQPVTVIGNTTSLLTASINRILGTSNTVNTINFYDDHNRLNQTKKIYGTYGSDIISMQYDFIGEPYVTIDAHQKTAPNAVNHVIVTKNQFDGNGRLVGIIKNIDGAPSDQQTGTYVFNEVGLLQNRSLGASLENLAYEYNVRGWLKTINKNFVNGSSSPSTNHFGMELAYDNTASTTGTTYTNAQFNGNIAGTIWKSAGDGVGRKYDFTYDNVNRLTAANFVQNTSSTTWDNSYIDFTTNNITYDANGNIYTMNQKGFKVGGSALIDQLTYTYATNSNKLNQVNDAVNDPNSKLGDFHFSNTKNPTDYTYDANGNLNSDRNKVISAITYNYLNLPLQATVSGEGNIAYTYDASGNKLLKVTTDTKAGKTTTTQYLGGFVYVNDTLQFAAHEEGRARWAYHKYLNGTTAYGFEYDYFVKDHLGNTRVVVTQEKDTAQYIATMEAAYRSTESQLFGNIAKSSYARTLVSGYPNDVSVTNPNDSIINLAGGQQKVGPNLLLKVMSGDKIDIAVQYYFPNLGTAFGPVSSLTDVVNSIANGLVSMTAGSKGTFGDLSASTGPVYSAANSFMSINNPTPSGKPKAYLNWMLLDEQLKYVSSSPQSGALPVLTAGFNGTQLQAPLSMTGIPITKSGYLYVWVSNETPNWNVYFDNLSVKHYSGPMLEETHYYPFGLTMAGISSKALKTNYVENKYKYNSGSEIANKEFADGSGLEMYETDFRGYDSQIGRFGQPDPFGEIFEDWSLYTYAFDNPVLFNDPLGLEAESADANNSLTKKHPKPKKPKYKWLPEVIVIGKKKDCKTCIIHTVNAGPAPTSAAPLNWLNWPNSTAAERKEWDKDQGLYFDRINSGQPLIQGGESQHYLDNLLMYLQWTKAEHESKVMQVGSIAIMFGPWAVMEVAAPINFAELYQQAYFWTELGYNIAIRDFIYAVRYGMAARLSMDQIIRLERLAEKYRDLHKILTPETVKKVLEKVNDIIKH